MAEVGAREVLGPGSIIPLHIFLAESTQPETIRGKDVVQHHFLPGCENAAYCSETWPVQVLCSTAWRAASEMGVIVQQSNDDGADGGER